MSSLPASSAALAVSSDVSNAAGDKGPLLTRVSVCSTGLVLS